MSLPKVLIAHPSMAALHAEVLARCKQYVNPSHAAFIDNRLNRTDWVGAAPNCGRNWQKLPDLILAAILTDDARWGNTLASTLRVLTQDNSPIKAYIHAPITDPITPCWGAIIAFSRRNAGWSR